MKKVVIVGALVLGVFAFGRTAFAEAQKDKTEKPPTVVPVCTSCTQFCEGEKRICKFSPAGCSGGNTAANCDSGFCGIIPLFCGSTAAPRPVIR